MAEVVVSRVGHVVELRIDRADKKNALTFAMYEALTAALREAQAEPSVRVALVTASGETFCAGNDIAEFLKPRADFAAAPPSRFIQALVDFDKPLVAAVHGSAVGIGATMLLHCDLVYASPTARLRMPFVSLGLVPEAGSSMLLPRRVGDAVAAEMLLLGAWIDAARARELRLVNAVLPDVTELLAFARARAEELAALPPAAVRATRALLRGQLDPTGKEKAALRARIDDEARAFAERLTSPEAREAFTAFLERRAPDFSKF
jgi:enoyl-CoA hydratase/carnithine racemase